MNIRRAEAKTLRSLVVPIWFCCVLGAARADELLDRAVSGVQKRYAAVESVSAAFQQIYRAPGIDQTESGTLIMKKPGLMRWDYALPEKKLFVADGRETWLYVPADRQVMVRSFTAADLRNTPLRFLLGQGEILASYRASWEKDYRPQGAGIHLFRLTPRAAGQEYEFIVLECDANSYDLRRIILREASGNSTEFLFGSMTMNPKTDRRQFQFKPPQGVEIIRLDEK